MSKSVVQYLTDHKELGIPVTGPEWFDLWTDTSAIKTCNWFQSMANKTAEKVNKAAVRVQNMKLGLPQHDLDTTQMTVRQCPTIVEYLSRCLVIKAPCDIDFALTDGSMYNLNLHDKVYTTMYADYRMPAASSHPRMQYTGDSEHFKDHVNIKIDTCIHLVCPPNIEPMFQQPIYHNPNAPFKIVPGVFKEPYKRYASLIWNVMVPMTVEEFSIKKGDALLYVYFNDRVKFEYSTERQAFFKDRFYKPMSLITDLLDKKK